MRLDGTITHIAPGGEGVMHANVGGERRAVFLAHAAPGDVIRAEVDLSRRPARGRIVELLAPSGDRVAPACAWSDRCGGCDWMHLSAGAQAREHLRHVRDALPPEWRHATIRWHSAPAPLAYRARARVHLKSVRGGRVAVGMHEARTHEPVEVERCAVLDPALDRARQALGPLLEGSRGRGDAQLALGLDRRPVVDVRWVGDVSPAAFGRLEQAVAAGQLAGARITLDGASRPAVVGDAQPWMTAADGAPMRLAPGGFGQANEEVNAALADHVAEHASRAEAQRAVELYAGAGNFSVLLARRVRDLVVVEASRDACEAARANLAARGLKARVVEADAATYAFGPATDLLVLDPPRAGAREPVDRLAASRVRHVVYVSCDTATLARDLGRLAPAYALRSVAAFEMFPQTSHVEVVVAIERRRGRKDDTPGAAEGSRAS